VRGRLRAHASSRALLRGRPLCVRARPSPHSLCARALAVAARWHACHPLACNARELRALGAPRDQAARGRTWQHARRRSLRRLCRGQPACARFACNTLCPPAPSACSSGAAQGCEPHKGHASQGACCVPASRAAVCAAGRRLTCLPNVRRRRWLLPRGSCSWRPTTTPSRLGSRCAPRSLYLRYRRLIPSLGLPRTFVIIHTWCLIRCARPTC